MTGEGVGRRNKGRKRERDDGLIWGKGKLF
jgi:hypothetical protein